MRLAHTHVWPELSVAAMKICGIAFSKSTSAMTTHGSLPPSSSVKRLSVAEQLLATRRPVALEPVKDTLRMPSCSVTAIERQQANWRLGNAVALTPRAEAVVADDDLHNAGREELLRSLDDADVAKRRERARLDDDRVAGQHGRNDLPDHEQDREVPGGGA